MRLQVKLSSSACLLVRGRGVRPILPSAEVPGQVGAGAEGNSSQDLGDWDT